MDDFVKQKLIPKSCKPSDSTKWLKKKDIQGDELLFSTEFAEILCSKKDGSERFIPFLKPLIENPFEKWVVFFQSTVSGRVEIVLTYIAAYRDEKTNENFVLILKCDRMGENWVASDLFAVTPEQSSLFRTGRLMYGRPKDTENNTALDTR